MSNTTLNDRIIEANKNARLFEHLTIHINYINSIKSTLKLGIYRDTRPSFPSYARSIDNGFSMSMIGDDEVRFIKDYVERMIFTNSVSNIRDIYTTDDFNRLGEEEKKTTRRNKTTIFVKTEEAKELLIEILRMEAMIDILYRKVKLTLIVDYTGWKLRRALMDARHSFYKSNTLFEPYARALLNFRDHIVDDQFTALAARVGLHKKQDRHTDPITTEESSKEFSEFKELLATLPKRNFDLMLASIKSKVTTDVEKLVIEFLEDFYKDEA